MPKQILLPGYQKRLKVFRKRFARLREDTMLRERDFQYIVPLMAEDRIQYWRWMGAPTNESLSLIAQVFNVPIDYLWPPMPEDGVRLDRDIIREKLAWYQKNPPRTPEEQTEYETLLEIERNLSGVGYITFNLRPTAKLVCVLSRLPLRPELLPGWEETWENAMVLPLADLKPADPVYAYRLQAKTGEFERGTLVVFVPLQTDPGAKDLVIGVRRQLPHIAPGAEWPEDATPLGRIIMSLREH